MNHFWKKQISKICIVVFFSIQMVFIIGCASVRPMDRETIEKYGLLDNLEKFKVYQYFVSRDIVLTATEVDRQTDVSGGQAFSSTRTHRDVLQLLASTPGKCLDYDAQNNRLGIEFDNGSQNLLWFYYDEGDDYFYLDYTDRSKGEIEYAGKIYAVSYEEATGIGATFTRLTTSNKATDDYQNMEPLLLYEENVKETETESRRTLGGSTL